MVTAMMKTTTKPAFLMEVTVVDLMSTHSTVLNVYVMNKDYATQAHFVEYNILSEKSVKIVSNTKIEFH